MDGICGKCGKMLGHGEYLKALNKSWHPDCFNCDECQISLVGGSFFEREGKLLCEADFRKKYITHCEGCKKPISGKAVRFGETVWHMDCFKCQKCGKSLTSGGLFKIDETPCCKDCFYESREKAAQQQQRQAEADSNGDRLSCPGCGNKLQPATEKIVKFRNRFYHVKCMDCMKCGSKMNSDKYFVENKMLVCENCHNKAQVPADSERCSACREDFSTDTSKTQLHGKLWHKKCLKCSSCSKSLLSSVEELKGSKLRDDSIFCSSCFEKGAASSNCAGCGKPLGPRIAKLIGKSYHPECVKCTKCEASLIGKKYVSVAGDPVCEDCIGSIDSPLGLKCHVCGRPLGSEPGLEALGHAYHASCFRCSYCGEVLAGGKFRAHEGKPYCSGCHSQHIVSRVCFKCKKPIIKENVVKALGQTYHVGCFVCEGCDASFSTGRSCFQHAGSVFCRQCYLNRSRPKCDICGEPIVDGKVLSAMKMKMHEKCFKCSICSSQFVDGKFAMIGEEPHCRDCYLSIMMEKQRIEEEERKVREEERRAEEEMLKKIEEEKRKAEEELVLAELEKERARQMQIRAEEEKRLADEESRRLEEELLLKEKEQKLKEEEKKRKEAEERRQREEEERKLQEEEYKAKAQKMQQEKERLAKQQALAEAERRKRIEQAKARLREAAAKEEAERKKVVEEEKRKLLQERKYLEQERELVLKAQEDAEKERLVAEKMQKEAGDARRKATEERNKSIAREKEAEEEMKQIKKKKEEAEKRIMHKKEKLNKLRQERENRLRQLEKEQEQKEKEREEAEEEEAENERKQREQEEQNRQKLMAKFEGAMMSLGGESNVNYSTSREEITKGVAMLKENIKTLVGATKNREENEINNTNARLTLQSDDLKKKISELITSVEGNVNLKNYLFCCQYLFHTATRQLIEFSSKVYVNVDNPVFISFFKGSISIFNIILDWLIPPEMESGFKPFEVEDSDIIDASDKLFKAIPTSKGKNFTEDGAQIVSRAAIDIYIVLTKKATMIACVGVLKTLSYSADVIFAISHHYCAQMLAVGVKPSDRSALYTQMKELLVISVPQLTRCSSLQKIAEDGFHKAQLGLEYTKMHALPKPKKLVAGQKVLRAEKHELTKYVGNVQEAVKKLKHALEFKVMQDFNNSMKGLILAINSLSDEVMEWLAKVDDILQRQRVLRSVVFLGQSYSLLKTVHYKLNQLWIRDKCRLNPTGDQLHSYDIRTLDNVQEHVAVNLAFTSVIERLGYWISVLVKQFCVDSKQDVEFGFKETETGEADNIWEETANTSQVIRYSDEERDGVTVKVIVAANLNKLVETLTALEGVDQQFIGAFMTTYRSFTSPAKIFRKLKQRYWVKPLPGESKDHLQARSRKIQLRVLITMKHWLEKAYFDFKGDLKKDMNDFLEVAEGDSFVTIVKSLKAILDGNRGAASLEKRLLFGINKPMEWKKTMIKDLPSQFIVDSDPDVISAQLCILDFEMYRLIQPVEFLNLAWNVPKYHHRAPNLRLFLDRFNLLSNFVASSIVFQPSFSERAALVTKWIDIMKGLRQQNNFYSIMALISGLENSAVHRMKVTLSEVAKRQLDFLSSMKKLMSTNASFKAYRAALHNCNPPLVPYIGVYLTDLTFIEEGNPDCVDHLVNFQKRQQIYGVISEIEQYQQEAYASEMDSCFMLLSSLPSLSEEVMYDISLLREPRGATKNQLY